MDPPFQVSLLSNIVHQTYYLKFTDFATCSVDNNASSGGALLSSRSTVYSDGAIYESNFALSGGAIHATTSELNITNCTFRKNNAASGQGGAVSLGNGDTSRFRSTKFITNFAKNGGALFTVNANVSLEDCTFNGNNASAGGACVFLDHSSVHAQKIMFEENHAYLESGGAIGINSNSKLHAFNVTIRGKVKEHRLY